VAVARALANSPAVVFADEPSGNLDGENARNLQDLIWRLRESRGQTFVIASHDPGIVRRVDRVVALANGVATPFAPARLESGEGNAQ
jgi:predicted ABC-type transport system involved in lysophospholipase L1 biosynthesis ATPase subunit